MPRRRHLADRDPAEHVAPPSAEIGLVSLRWRHGIVSSLPADKHARRRSMTDLTLGLQSCLELQARHLPGELR
jgi:hypothetical protein